MTVRRATDSDTNAILSCLARAFAPFKSSYTEAAYLDTVLTMETVAERLQSMVLFVAVSDAGQVVGTIGCAAMENREGHLRGMAVLPEWQGSGLATRLLEQAESELRKLGCQHITLDTTTPLKRAVQFYTRHGYKATGRVTDFFGMELFIFEEPLKNRSVLAWRLAYFSFKNIRFASP